MSELKRVNTTLPSDIYEWIDEESKRTGIKKSTVIYIALKTYIDQQKTLKMAELADGYARQKILGGVQSEDE